LQEIQRLIKLLWEFGYPEPPTMDEVWDEKELMQIYPEEGPWKWKGGN